MTIQEILNTIENSHASYVLLLFHQNADPDALCSAYAFQGLLKRLVPSVVIEIGSTQGLSKLSKHLLQFLSIGVNRKPPVESAEVIVLLDTNTIEQLGDMAEVVRKSSPPIVVVDHHAPHPETLGRAALCITNEEASSACEVVYDFFKQAGVRPNDTEALAMFWGIAFDTRHFVLAKASTLKTLSELCDLGVNPQEALAILALPMDLSERMARMKACRRARLIKIGDWLLAFSHVSAFQASAARALVDLGAHVSAVAGERNGNVEISFRCTRDFVKGTGIHLGKDIAKPIGELLRGMGGGHAAAAGANGPGDVKTGLNYCFELFKEKLSKSE